MEFMIPFFVIMIILCLALIIGIIVYTEKQKAKIREQIQGLANNTLEMTVEEFFEMRKKSFGGRGRPSYALTQNFMGVYILYNKTKNMYYVGQGKEVLNRVNSHFT